MYILKILQYMENDDINHIVPPLASKKQLILKRNQWFSNSLLGDPLLKLVFIPTTIATLEF